MQAPRQRILETASALFHEQGYNSTGINQIIADAKVAKASFYHHFKSKENLCVEYLKKRHGYWFEKLERAIGACKTARGKVLASFDCLIMMNEMENFRGCSFLNILSELPSGDSEILGIIQGHKNDLRQHFQSLISDGEIADHAYLLFESAIIESQLYKSQDPIIRARSLVDKLMISEHGTKTTPPTV